MDPTLSHTYTAFLDGRRLAAGPLHEVAVAVLHAQKSRPDGHPLVFSDASGRSADLDLRGGEKGVTARYTVVAPEEAPRGRGRPKLGVVAREVTLLPEHWDWLAGPTGRPSVAPPKPVPHARAQGRPRGGVNVPSFPTPATRCRGARKAGTGCTAGGGARPFAGSRHEFKHPACCHAGRRWLRRSPHEQCIPAIRSHRPQRAVH